MNKNIFLKALIVMNLFLFTGCGQESGLAPSLGSDGGGSGGDSGGGDGGGGGGGGGGGSTGPTACNPCKIFPTAATIEGDFAYYSSIISAADSKCANDTNKPADGKTYKALFMGGSRSISSDWVLHPDTTFTRPDGTVIGSSDSNGWLQTTALSNSMTGTTDKFWTGIKAGWVENASANCNFWTDGTSSENGMAARGDSTGFVSVGGSTTSCDNSLGFLCVEQ